MKKVIVIFLFALLSACGDSDSNNTSGAPQDGGGAVENPPGANGDGTNGQPGGSPPPADEEQAFVVGLYETNLAEIEIARIAVERAETEEAQALAQRVFEHHSFMNEELEGLAATLGVTVPGTFGEEAAERIQAMRDLAQDEFDETYANHTVALYERLLTQFRDHDGLATDAGNGNAAGAQLASGDSLTPVERFAANHLAALQIHLMAARTLAGSLDPAVFLVNLYQGGLAEIRYAELAVERAQDVGVLAYAQRMIEDHRRANDEIAAVAAAANASLPEELTPEQQRLEQELAQLAGADFDWTYMNHNVIAHQITVAQARVQAESSAITEVAALAANLVPVLQSHREEAERLYEALDPSLLLVAFQNSMGEILQSQVTLQRSDNEQVRGLATGAIDAYSDLRERVLRLAAERGVALPSEVSAEHVALYLQLAQVPGDEFDSAFLRVDADMHEALLQAVLRGLAEADQADLQDLAVRMLEIIRARLAAVQDALASI